MKGDAFARIVSFGVGLRRVEVDRMRGGAAESKVPHELESKSAYGRDSAGAYLFFFRDERSAIRRLMCSDRGRRACAIA